MIAAVLASFAVALAAAPSTQAGAPPAHSPVVRSDAEQWDVTSKITGRIYRIYVAKPADKGPPPPGGYPVVYLTDGDFTFQTAADAQMLLNGGMETKPAIIVAIGYGRGLDGAMLARFTDLTPSAPDPAMGAQLQAQPMFKGATYGEAEGFYRFLNEELRPQIEAGYKTDRSNNILFGHSLGGLFALHVLFNHPDAFRTYIVGSPSILWNNDAILKDAPKLEASVAAGKVAPRVLFTVGGLEQTVTDDTRIPPGMTRQQLQAMLTAVGEVTKVVALSDRLKALKGPADYKVETVVFDGETHISVLSAVINRGLRFALKP
jgi:predicted alpha/beta superfamily hydrolase